jgi:hypothetical protein
MVVGILSMNDIVLSTGAEGAVRTDDVVDALTAICEHHRHVVPHIIAA